MTTIPIKPTDAQWTDDQWQAIYTSGSDTLVSAAAGSGKTAVLITRLIEKIVKQQWHVDELLVVTFTNASAAEMRQRLIDALQKALEEDPTNQHLKRQQSLINKAQISTLHSFCLNIVRQYAYVIDIDPGFRMATESEVALFKDDVLAQVLEEAYADPTLQSEVYQLVDSFTSDRDDQAIETLIVQLYEMSRVHAQPSRWLDEIIALYDVEATTNIDALSFMPVIIQAITNQLEAAEALNAQFLANSRLPAGPAPHGKTADEMAVAIREAKAIVASGNFHTMYAYFSQFKASTIGRVTKKDLVDEALKEKGAAYYKAIKNCFDQIKTNFFVRTPERLLQEMQIMVPLLKTLQQLTERFATAYQKLKEKRAVVDFSDLEHYALAILTEQQEDALIPSQIAKDYQRQFKEVLVDEYQDVNILQETLLQLIKSGTEQEGNLFMVGDVKQSIYRFRLAEPHLFLRKYRTFTPQHALGQRIDLNANFRSRKEVLHATNFIFSQVMSEEVGEIAYDDKASLKVGATYDDKVVPVELALIETATDEALTSAEAEARYIVTRIQQLMANETTVYDTKTQSERLLMYRDIVIVTRSMSWSHEIVEAFKQAEIPLYAETSGGYFEALEVMIMLNVLKCVDNPYQDIALASVLRAPFIGLTENELAAIRLAHRKLPFFDALQAFMAQEHTEIDTLTAEKLHRFLQQFKQWRDLSRRGSLADLIWRIYNDTHYYDMVGAMANGKQRQANLRALHERALAYEKTSFRGLFRFLRFVERMRLRGDDLSSARAIGAQEDVVRLMTIHSSKGLEFPVVFVSGLGKKFNQQDFNGHYLFDQHYGLAVKAIDPVERIVFEALPYVALKEKKQLELRAEEMRILYVAMTRAKERLILVGSQKEVIKKVTQWQVDTKDGTLPTYLRATANHYLDWIVPALSRHEQFQLQEGEDKLINADDWQVAIIHEATIPDNQQEEQTIVNSQEVVASFNAIVNRFAKRYSYPHAVTKQTKTSVTALKKLSQLAAGQDDGWLSYQQVEIAPPERPNFMQEKQLTAMELGTAVHTIMQHLPITSTLTTTKAASAFIQSLVERELLTIAEAGAVDAAWLVQFYDSTIYALCKKATAIYRELPFTLRVVDEQGDAQILQGIMDAVLQMEDGSLYLIDYKSDRVLPHFSEPQALVTEMTKRYGEQMRIYGEALTTITKQNITASYIYLMREGYAVQL